MKNILNEWGKKRDPFIFLIDFECQHPIAWKLSELGDKVKFVFPTFSNTSKKTHQAGSIELKTTPIDLLTYKEMFDYVKHEIEYGNSFLTNLTCRTPVTINLTLEQLFDYTSAKYSFYLKNEFVCFSPETFIQIHDNKIYSHPMKGTIDASIPNAQELILNDEKEKAEHATIVDLIRNDLSRVAKRVEVSRYRYYEEIKTNLGVIGQISSEIMGDLEPDFNERIGDILFELLPAGSVSGAPKKKTLEIIKNAEKQPRGYYTGVAGFFDGKNLDSCVLIRYIDKDQLYYSGGGITSQSDLESEYSEMIKKIYVPVH